jgi:hypothetical protein
MNPAFYYSIKRVLLTTAFFLLTLFCFSQINEVSPWVWMKGDNIYNAGGAGCG